MKVVLHRRNKDDAPTFGEFTDDEEKHICMTLERPSTGDHPCIPAGTYTAKRDWHHPNDPHRYRCWELQDVPGRSEIQVHVANKASQLLGCIAPGEHYGMMDGEPAVLSSGDAYQRFMDITSAADVLTLEIRDP